MPGRGGAKQSATTGETRSTTQVWIRSRMNGYSFNGVSSWSSMSQRTLEPADARFGSLARARLAEPAPNVSAAQNRQGTADGEGSSDPRYPRPRSDRVQAPMEKASPNAVQGKQTLP